MEPLLKKLYSLWEANRPFVCYKLPSSAEVTLFFQKDAKLNLTKDLNCNGFLMAPFDLEKPIPFIPNQYAESHTIQKIKVKSDEHVVRSLDLKNKSTFTDLVVKGKEFIAKGELKKVVLSQAHQLASKRNAVEIFMDLIQYYPSAMVYLWHHPLVGTWFGASPEQFINTRGDFTQTMALAATQTFQENEAPKWTEKEIEEQELVSVQVESDLKTLFPSNQIVKSPTTNHQAGNLVHLCTHFQFPRLRGNLHNLSRVLHPTPAVGGIPKSEAQQFILNNEPYERGYYTGFFGLTNASETQFFVNLRCASWTPEKTTLYVGAGITSGSDHEKEWQEIQRKAKTLAKVL